MLIPDFPLDAFGRAASPGRRRQNAPRRGRVSPQTSEKPFWLGRCRQGARRTPGAALAVPEGIRLNDVAGPRSVDGQSQPVVDRRHLPVLIGHYRPPGLARADLHEQSD
jgi:hypothetical protein